MFFEEKIEWLKKHFTPAHFRIPFTDTSRILKAIEKEFYYHEKDMTSL